MSISDNKSILITGAGRGIGRAIAIQLAKKHNLLLFSRTKADLAALKETLLPGQTKVDYFAGDINQSADRERLFAFATNNFPPLDVLINNAGVYYKESIHKLDPRKVDEVMETNINSMIKLTQLFSKEFATRKRGQIINISSVAGLEGYKGDTIYCASKFAVTGFTKALFEDLREFNIRVTCIYSDFVNTWGAPKSQALLEPKDIAAAVEFVIDLPEYVIVQELRIRAIEDFKQEY